MQWLKAAVCGYESARICQSQLFETPRETWSVGGFDQLIQFFQLQQHPAICCNPFCRIWSETIRIVTLICQRW
jgi:hypothetical protein